jgi:hypothetical protein
MLEFISQSLSASASFLAVEVTPPSKFWLSDSSVAALKRKRARPRLDRSPPQLVPLEGYLVIVKPDIVIGWQRARFQLRGLRNHLHVRTAGVPTFMSPVLGLEVYCIPLARHHRRDQTRFS